MNRESAQTFQALVGTISSLSGASAAATFGISVMPLNLHNLEFTLVRVETEALSEALQSGSTEIKTVDTNILKLKETVAPLSPVIHVSPPSRPCGLEPNDPPGDPIKCLNDLDVEMLNETVTEFRKTILFLNAAVLDQPSLFKQALSEIIEDGVAPIVAELGTDRVGGKPFDGIKTRPQGQFIVENQGESPVINVTANSGEPQTLGQAYCDMKTAMVVGPMNTLETNYLSPDVASAQKRAIVAKLKESGPVSAIIFLVSTGVAPIGIKGQESYRSNTKLAQARAVRVMNEITDLLSKSQSVTPPIMLAATAGPRFSVPQDDDRVVRVCALPSFIQRVEPAETVAE